MVGGLIVVLIWMAWSFFVILAGMISGVLREEGLRGMMGQAPVVLPYPETVLLSVMLLVTFAGLWLGVFVAVRVLHSRALGSVVSYNRRFNFLQFGWGVAIGVGYLVVGVLSSFAMGHLPVRTGVEVGPWLVGLLPVCVLLLVQSSGEEVFFRGYLVQQLAVRFRQPLLWGVPAGIPLRAGALREWDDAGIFSLLCGGDDAVWADRGCPAVADGKPCGADRTAFHQQCRRVHRGGGGGGRAADLSMVMERQRHRGGSAGRPPRAVPAAGLRAVAMGAVPEGSALAAQERDAGCAVDAFVQHVPAGRFGRGLAGGCLGDNERFGQDPAAAAELVERGRYEVVGVRRIHKDQVEGGVEAGGLGAQVGGRAAVDPGVSEELERLDIVADAAAGGAVGFDKEAEGRAARDRLEAQRAGARKGVDDARAFERWGPGGMG